MDFKEIVTMALTEYMDELRKALDGLTAKERRYQPTPDSHHIDFAVWHMARVEDDWLQRFARRTESIWQRDGWDRKLGLPQRDSGFGYTAEQVRVLPAFDMDQMMAYYTAVRAETFRFVEGIAQADLESCPQPERRPGYTIGRMFSHLVVEESQHAGQIAYLRGMQRGLNQ